MSWAVSLGRPRRKQVPLNPFQKIESEWKAREAARMGAVAAALIACTHVLSALFWFYSGRHRPTLLSSDPFALGLFSAMLAVIAVVAGYVAYRRSPLWLAWVIVCWSALEALPWITAPLYGHAVRHPFPVLILIAGILGIRGVLALRKGFDQDAEVFA